MYETPPTRKKIPLLATTLFATITGCSTGPKPHSLDDIFAELDEGFDAQKCYQVVHNSQDIEAEVHRAMDACEPKILDPIIAAPPAECRVPAAKKCFQEIVRKWREQIYATCLKR